MASSPNGSESRPAWFVGAYSMSSREDHAPKYIEEERWENGYTDKYLDLVKSIQPGDRIAMKSTFTRKRELPFVNRGHYVSIMAIKATGTVKENMGDGRNLAVEWTPVEPPRKWYFFTNLKTIWEVKPGSSLFGDRLIRFTFDGEDQDIDWFRNVGYWKKRFGDDDQSSDPPVSPSEVPELPQDPPEIDEYTLEDITAEGCFLEEARLETILSRLKTKQNLILQGPPGTGKTWLATKLAFALLGRKDDDRVRRIQFHPNMSYEDFVRGYRPGSDSRLSLVDGPFLEVSKDAQKDPDNDYVVVIEAGLCTFMQRNTRSPASCRIAGVGL